MIYHFVLTARVFQRLHKFYAKVMGFKVVRRLALGADAAGWTRHLCNETGHGGLLAP